MSLISRSPSRPGPPLGQYLSGISAKPAAKPRAVKVGSNGKAGAQAVIVEEVTVGVAVTVGELSAMTTHFNIPGVLGTLEFQTPRLNIELDNTGQTFAKGTGTVSCTQSGKRHTYGVSADTVLPGGQALIAVNAPGLPTGATVPCTIQIRYGKNQTVRWAGTVAIPALPSTRIVHTGIGTYSQVPQGGIPGWAIALIIIGALLLVGVGSCSTCCTGSSDSLTEDHNESAHSGWQRAQAPRLAAFPRPAGRVYASELDRHSRPATT